MDSEKSSGEGSCWSTATLIGFRCGTMPMPKDLADASASTDEDANNADIPLNLHLAFGRLRKSQRIEPT